MNWQALLWVGCGGFFGANARYILSLWLTQRLSEWSGWRVPFGTIFVNVTGSFLLAFFLVWATQRGNVPQPVRFAVGTGFFGAYTTFSTYANESVDLIMGVEWRIGLVYIIASNVLCLLGVLLGLALATRLFTT